jgi:hypothetical protein
VPIAAVDTNTGPLAVAALTDSNPESRWISPEAQRPGTSLTLDLGGPQPLCGLTLSMGHEGELYPRALEVATSPDGTNWTTVSDAPMGGAAMRATLADPLNAEIDIPLAGSVARYVRLRLMRGDAVYHWAVAGIRVRAGSRR